MTSRQRKLTSKERQIAPEPLSEVDLNLLDSNSISITNSWKYGKIIDDSIYKKISFNQRIIFSAISNISLLQVALLLGTPGQSLEIPRSVASAAPIMLCIWMSLNSIWTVLAMNDGLAIYSGWLLSQARGASLTICGFAQASSFSKLTFSYSLKDSRSKTLFSRLSYAWLVQLGLSVLALAVPPYLFSTGAFEDNGYLSCMYYQERGYPAERTWPTVDVVMGAAMFQLDGSIGIPRSTTGKEVYSTFILSPKLIDKTKGASMIEGSGFSTRLSASCFCSNPELGLKIESIHSSLIMKTLNSSISAGISLVNSMSFDKGSITVNTAFVGMNVCPEISSLPFCNTLINNHYNAQILATYAMQGRKSSKTKVHVSSLGNAANMTWVYLAMNATLGGNISSLEMPATEEMQNPLLWQMTRDKKNFEFAFLEIGMEALLSKLLDSGMHRIYRFQATRCLQKVKSALLNFHIHRTGFRFLIVFCSYQIAMVLIAAYFTTYWHRAKYPIYPGIHLVANQAFFLAVVGQLIRDKDKRYNNLVVDNGKLWRSLDLNLRIGESIDSMDNEKLGILILADPSIVRDLSWTKRYT